MNCCRGLPPPAGAVPSPRCQDWAVHASGPGSTRPIRQPGRTPRIRRPRQPREAARSPGRHGLATRSAQAQARRTVRSHRPIDRRRGASGWRGTSWRACPVIERTRLCRRRRLARVLVPDPADGLAPGPSMTLRTLHTSSSGSLEYSSSLDNKLLDLQLVVKLLVLK